MERGTGASTVRKRLLKLVKRHGTLEAFSKAIGVPRRNVQRWINEDVGLNLKSLVKIAESQKVSLDWLVLGRPGRVLQAEDELADQLWQRVHEILLDEGAEPELAEMAIPAPDDLLREVLRPYVGRGKGLGNSNWNPGALLAHIHSPDAARELDLQCDALLKQVKEMRAMYDSLDAIRMRLAMNMGDGGSTTL